MGEGIHTHSSPAEQPGKPILASLAPLLQRLKDLATLGIFGGGIISGGFGGLETIDGLIVGNSDYVFQGLPLALIGFLSALATLSKAGDVLSSGSKNKTEQSRGLLY